MRKVFHLIILVSCIFFNTASAQIADPIHWSFHTTNINTCEVELVFEAKLEGSWHLYGQKSYGEDGPVPTSFHFTTDSTYELIGSTSEETLIKKFEPVFGAELNYFEHKALFKQKIKIKSVDSIKIKGEFEYMVCNEVTCMPPTTLPFLFTLEGSGDCIPGSEQSYWTIFVLGFLGGFAALLTPCVFPLIPLTVSFFTKQSKTRAKGISNALTYSFAIVAIYVTLGLVVTSIFGSTALHAISTSIWFNLSIFILLVIFATSFLGAFEIVLPSRFVNKIDAKSEKEGVIGILFMAFTLSLVSFSCTGPIIGTLLVDTAVNGGIIGPFWGMLGFSIALALPFSLFSAFPGWLNSLPKAGGWLNSVKIVLGLLELALALKFASNADLVVQTGIITREVFIAVWVVIFGIMGIYLLGKIKFPHDTDTHHLSVPRLFFAILALSFTVYLIPGLWGAPLKLIHGFPPPDFYKEAHARVGGKTEKSSTTNYIDHERNETETK